MNSSNAYVTVTGGPDSLHFCRENIQGVCGERTQYDKNMQRIYTKEVDSTDYSVENVKTSVESYGEMPADKVLSYWEKTRTPTDIKMWKEAIPRVASANYEPYCNRSPFARSAEDPYNATSYRNGK